MTSQLEVITDVEAITGPVCRRRRPNIGRSTNRVRQERNRRSAAAATSFPASPHTKDDQLRLQYYDYTMADSAGDGFGRPSQKRSRPTSPEESDPRRWLATFRGSGIPESGSSNKRSRNMDDFDMDQPADLSVKKDRSSSSGSKDGEGSEYPSMESGGRHSRHFHGERGTPDNDIIVLSDEDGPRMNGHLNGCGGSGSDDEFNIPPMELKQLSPEELKERERVVRRLRSQLRNEEMKLVLLKKLRQSQQMKENLSVGPTSGKAPTINRGGPPTTVPPPLVRGAQVTQTKQMTQQQAQQHMMMPPLVRPQNLQGPPPLVMAPRVTSSSTLPANVMLQQSMIRGPSIMGRMPLNTPPNVVLGYPPMQGQSQNSLLQSSNSGNNSSSNQNSQNQSSAAERLDNQTPAQRQAAAKLALRKQLEKTLLQIPPPKPPPPEMHFIPNPSNTEFIYLVGLEVVVNFITEDKKPDDAPKPFDCVQCGTDFTPVWKWDNSVKQTVVCEQCVTSNIKKALKAEHTNRLKTAFVKALQQEQEIEQSMAQVSSSPPATVAPPTVPQIPKLSESMRQTPTNLSLAHQQMLRMPQHQPLPAHMLSFSPLLSQAYPYQVLGKAPVSSPEIQRQYLLDMIPPRSMPQGTINWKT